MKSSVPSGKSVLSAYFYLLCKYICQCTKLVNHQCFYSEFFNKSIHLTKDANGAVINRVKSCNFLFNNDTNSVTESVQMRLLENPN